MTKITKPVMLYDGDCGFCVRWIERWKKKTQAAVEYQPYQKILDQYPQVTKEECEVAVQLIMSDGSIHSGAHAVFHAFDLVAKYRWVLWLYEHVPFFAGIAEGVYQLVAHHRSFFSHFAKPK